ncbi:hypothetical protein ACFQ2M_25435 [Kitasatospora saccharophila]|uniref:hypothetical protein n=1 Tax=Kitasatospora saccharophila TaxID=407973 RepID=UPI003632F4D2
MSTWHPPAPPGLHTGPLRKRSVVGLWLEFCLQWFWTPVRYFVLDGGWGLTLPRPGTASNGAVPGRSGRRRSTGSWTC